MKKFCALLVMSLMISGCSNLNIFSEKNNTLKGELITLSEDTNFSEVASKVESAIVGISGLYSSGESVGSGVCVSQNGYILTNSHVVSDAKAIVVYMADKTTTKASLVYDNPVQDLAIIKCNKTLPYLAIGSSDELSVGEDIMAVGTPLSLSLTHTFTKGIISALNRTLKVDGTSGEGYMQNLIQHDASLNPGNSGGPLLNSRGEVVGINTLKISTGEGIGFAIPSKSFESLLGSYVENINYTLPYLGVYGLDSEIANYYDSSKNSKGFYIIDVSSSSPLNDCGVKPTSVITKFNGRDINNTLDLQDELYKLDANDTVHLQFIYNNEIFNVKTKLK